MHPAQRAIGQLDAVHPHRADLGVCLAELAPVGGCMDRSRDYQLLRTDFHLLILCTEGEADQLVDLEVHRHRAGSLVWIRPGQVHERPPLVRGTVICFTDAFLGASGAAHRGPTSWHLAGADLADLRSLLDVFSREYERFVFGPTGASQAGGDALLRHLLEAILLRLGQSPPQLSSTQGIPNPVAMAFLDLVERSYGSIHTVEDYALALGYSPKTLCRASVGATGLTPKQLIDARLAREARRLLAYTDLPCAAVGRRLGFEDPANVSGARAAVRRGGGGSGPR